VDEEEERKGGRRLLKRADDLRRGEGKERRIGHGPSDRSAPVALKNLFTVRDKIGKEEKDLDKKKRERKKKCATELLWNKKRGKTEDARKGETSSSSARLSLCK